MKFTKKQIFNALKKETIKKVNGKYVLYPKKGGKRLGTHDSKDDANDQEAAIQISKHGRTGREVEASNSSSIPGYQSPLAFKKSTFKAISVDDEDDSNELLGGLRDKRKQDAKLDREGKDHEGSMAKSQLERSMKYSKMIYNMIQNVDKDGDGEVEFPAWVQSKLTKSMDYLQSVFNYLDGKDGLEDKFQESINEEAYKNASRNELAQYIINLNNQLKGAKSRKMKKHIKFIEKDIADVKKALAKKKNESVNELDGYSPQPTAGKFNPPKMAYSNPESQQNVEDDMKKMGKLFNKTSQQSIAIMLSGVKNGKYDAMDLIRGIHTGPASSTSMGVKDMIQVLWNKVDKRFRKYLGGKKRR
jgi:hypothetical protein|tara:strand:- start:579 stop:1655 length:1077 start_codon:yes stop_codon:yes gene_type:complete